MKKIKKLDLNLFPGDLEENYKKEKAEYILEYGERYLPGGFLTSGRYVKDPAIGEAKWNNKYPQGYKDWANEKYRLTSSGQQRVINTIDKLIDRVEELNKLINKSKKDEK